MLLSLNLGNEKVGRLQIQMGASKNSGTPKWMVKIMENPINIDDLEVKPPYFWKHPNTTIPHPTPSPPIFWSCFLLQVICLGQRLKGGGRPEFFPHGFVCLFEFL